MIGLLQHNAPQELIDQASQLGIAIWAKPSESATHILQWNEDRLELVSIAEKATVCVDFVSGAAAHRRQFGGGRGQPVAKAVGIKGDYIPRVLDATAGLGGDAFVLASLGCTMTLIERTPIAYLLLSDGLKRAAADTHTKEIAARMSLHFGDGRKWLTERAAGIGPFAQQEFDVVYLDPMFPEPGKRAKSKKNMAAFQTLIGGDEDADALLAPARLIAKKRIIVKRPRHAPLLANARPDFVFDGESTRFDGYLPSNGIQKD
ncbi:MULTISPECIES: class I SAM-dependent methyltransferase [Deefgea]|uniref:Ribosomal RNA small subunit methyltransferase J n=1 Tax=Deefgea chitinilytica TaxID=570276 RepID=A0ABS2CAL3_9NEIS|nr:MULTISPECIES: class I SAM-dependent methyltransferase [Deefgea]MBM5571203.1 16S rRNA methyltransferase [Deefgea chitinilytica]MBM9888435.1 class I SAM-dependent methyltransferase [Deefgea sp. CFH1-16]